MIRSAGIIGSGNIGSAVAQRLIAARYRVVMANTRGPASLEEHARRLGVIPGTVEDAVAAQDFIVIAIPEHAVAALGEGLFAQVAPETVILDTGNYYPGVRDGSIAIIDEGLCDSEWVARTIGQPVVKMFNTIHANRIAESFRPSGASDRICLPVAGDERTAKMRAIAMADAIGFDAIDTGTLAESWRQQPGTPVYCTHLPIALARTALTQARREEVTLRRQEAIDRAHSINGGTSERIGLWPLPGTNPDNRK